MWKSSSGDDPTGVAIAQAVRARKKEPITMRTRIPRRSLLSIHVLTEATPDERVVRVYVRCCPAPL